MTRHYFGTDGIRGRVFDGKITPEIALKVGLAAGNLLSRGDHRHKVIIGKDTRRSCYMLEASLGAGFSAAGMDVLYTGPMPTPAIARLVTSLKCDAGVMISASHNPHYDNGLKFFGPDGYKIADTLETEIERLLQNESAELYTGDPATIGHVARDDEVRGRYIEYIKATIPDHISFEGLKIVLDCANGAGYKVAPTALEELGAEVIPLGVSPNGLNINDKCGSTYPEAMCQKVIDEKAHIGIALDGDADRVIICDEEGRIIDGDKIIAYLASKWKAAGKLKSNTIVTTVMSNKALELYLNENGLCLKRSKVGDRNVLKDMLALGSNIGGEQSGHIIFTDHAKTGDGLLAGIQIIHQLLENKQTCSEIYEIFTPLPQRLTNIKYGNKNPLQENRVQEFISLTEEELGAQGRLLIRESGTEPLIRILVEADTEHSVQQTSEKLASFIQEAIDDL
ncbi:phosphoglucosamine mutase [Temperatibacter marinus]|uniref:Phosphoglucosamine mutase n=1 Tax=Temperatibacter marinus TaxID=1456591 RepID=A0AA52H9G5_9PROT|nr:phosphoglucosamine mutase [Temperatibacter marinus]WND03171.1 phosphoglucosamine mutase [Temperatibacter marinus]